MLKPLTSLRFIFALMVFVFHLDSIMLIRSNSKALNWIFHTIFKEGFIGVSFFFILSGFILAYNYQKSFIEKTRTKRSFFIARFARIYPLHVLCFILSIPLIFSFDPLNPSPLLDPLNFLKNAVFNLTLTQSFTLDLSIIFSFNALSWSISNEMFFYLTFPFIVSLMPFFFKTRYKYHLLVIFLSIIPLLIPLFPSGLYHRLFYLNPSIRIFDFTLGILLFNLYEKIKDKKYFSSLNFNYLEYLSISVFLIFVILHSYIPIVYRFTVYYWLPMCLLILVFAFQKGYVSKLLSNDKMVLLGEISFGFYMIHALVIRYSLIPFYSRSIENVYLSIGLIIFAFSLTLLLSYISFKKFETPMNKYIKKRFK